MNIQESTLGTTCTIVEFDDPVRLQKIGVQLCHILEDTPMYNSISANQCGLTEQIFCTRIGYDYKAYFNPQLINVEGDLIEGIEECQNYPQEQYNIIRPSTIEVKFYDYMGNFSHTEFDNPLARSWLKGYDYCMGLTLQDRANTTTLPEEMIYNVKTES